MTYMSYFKFAPPCCTISYNNIDDSLENNEYKSLFVIWSKLVMFTKGLKFIDVALRVLISLRQSTNFTWCHYLNNCTAHRRYFCYQWDNTVVSWKLRNILILVFPEQLWKLTQMFVYWKLDRYQYQRNK